MHDFSFYDRIIQKDKEFFMRKRILLSVVLSLCVAQFGAFAATAQRGNARGGNTESAGQQQNGAAPVAARAGKMQGKVNGVNTGAKQPAAPSVGGGVAARAGKKQTQVNPGGQVMAARAASTQKVINNGTKVSTATANTVVNQECQNAFYGCMDSFCMLDNASGGRCQCSDRNADLTKVMDDIAKLDEQSYKMATEGVERIKMGEDAEAVLARAKAAGDKVTGKASAEENAKKARTLDLNAWNTNIFSDDGDDPFDGADVSVDSSAVSNALSKTGDALYSSAAKMCIEQMPGQCGSSVQMLQNMYAQKIKSDCMAFENSLKQQKIASTQKLQAAEKALRDASLEKFQEENKYATTGECVTAYAQCMQGECGSDYSKCITFAAEENIKTSSGVSKVNEKKRTIKGVVDIVLSGSTMNQLMSKKTICDGNVLKYCVNHKNEVWDKYLEYAATTLKAAELNAEDNLRQNCTKELATCFKKACAAEFDPNAENASYDMCLSDPLLVVDFCKVKLDACIVATGGQELKSGSKDAMKKALEGSRLWSGVTSMLAGMRVDACTKEVKAGIESICGENFAHCVGLNPYTIANLLPFDKLTACKTENKRNDEEMLEYIADIAQGYALEINDSLYARCENAAKEAMVKVCGNSESCDTLNLGNMSFDSLLRVELCIEDEKTGEITCKDSVNDFDQQDIILGHVLPHIRNRVNVNSIVYNSDRNNDQCSNEAKFNEMRPVDKLSCYKGFSYELLDDKGQVKKSLRKAEKYLTNGFDAKKTDLADPSSLGVQSILKGLNNVFNTKMKVMLTDKTVSECMNGKDVTGFVQDNSVDGKQQSSDKNKRDIKGRISNATEDATQDLIYENLMDSYQQVIISKTLELLRERYDEAEAALQPDIDAAYAKISERLKTIEGIAVDNQHRVNEKTCKNYAKKNNDRDGFESTNSGGFFKTGCVGAARDSMHAWTKADYDRDTTICTVTRTEHLCTKKIAGCCWSWDGKGVPSTITYRLPMINSEDIIKTAKDGKEIKREY